MDKVMKLYLNDQISKEGFGKEYRPLEERAKQLEEQIPQLQGEIDFLKIQYLSSDDVFHEAQDLYSRWQTLEREEKRKVIENITERIVIGKDDVTINLCYLPSSSEIMAEKQRGLKGSWPRQA
jgi:TolA-binding protein